MSALTKNGLVGTGAGPSLMSLTAWEKIARFDKHPIKNADIHLIAANDQELNFLLVGYKRFLS